MSTDEAFGEVMSASMGSGTTAATSQNFPAGVPSLGMFSHTQHTHRYTPHAAHPSVMRQEDFSAVAAAADAEALSRAASVSMRSQSQSASPSPPPAGDGAAAGTFGNDGSGGSHSPASPASPLVPLPPAAVPSSSAAAAAAGHSPPLSSSASTRGDTEAAPPSDGPAGAAGDDDDSPPSPPFGGGEREAAAAGSPGSAPPVPPDTPGDGLGESLASVGGAAAADAADAAAPSLLPPPAKAGVPHLRPLVTPTETVSHPTVELRVDGQPKPLAATGSAADAAGFLGGHSPVTLGSPAFPGTTTFPRSPMSPGCLSVGSAFATTTPIVGELPSKERLIQMSARLSPAPAPGEEGLAEVQGMLEAVRSRGVGIAASTEALEGAMREEGAETVAKIVGGEQDLQRTVLAQAEVGARAALLEQARRGRPYAAPAAPSAEDKRAKLERRRQRELRRLQKLKEEELLRAWRDTQGPQRQVTPQQVEAETRRLQEVNLVTRRLRQQYKDEVLPFASDVRGFRERGVIHRDGRGGGGGGGGGQQQAPSYQELASSVRRGYWLDRIDKEERERECQFRRTRETGVPDALPASSHYLSTPVASASATVASPTPGERGPSVFPGFSAARDSFEFESAAQGLAALRRSERPAWT